MNQCFNKSKKYNTQEWHTLCPAILNYYNENSIKYSCNRICAGVVIRGDNICRENINTHSVSPWDFFIRH